MENLIIRIFFLESLSLKMHQPKFHLFTPATVWETIICLDRHLPLISSPGSACFLFVLYQAYPAWVNRERGGEQQLLACPQRASDDRGRLANGNVKPDNRMLLLLTGQMDTTSKQWQTGLKFFGKCMFCVNVCGVSFLCIEWSETSAANIVMNFLQKISRFLLIPFSSNRGRNNSSYDSTNPFTMCVKR